jgi:soluble cytochrome b562
MDFNTIRIAIAELTTALEAQQQAEYDLEEKINNMSDAKDELATAFEGLEELLNQLDRIDPDALESALTEAQRVLE